MIRLMGQRALRRSCPPYRRMEERLHASAVQIRALEAERDGLVVKNAQAEADLLSLRSGAEEPEGAASALRLRIERGERYGTIDPAWFEDFPFRSGDLLTVLPTAKAAKLPNTWDDTHIRVANGHAIRVPRRWNIYEFKGFSIPIHLINLTGAGPETLDLIGKQHIANYQRFLGLCSGMTVLDLGCGIGRDAFQLIDFLDSSGFYIGVDVTDDSIAWCNRNISREHANFSFYHFDVNEAVQSVWDEGLDGFPPSCKRRQRGPYLSPRLSSLISWKTRSCTTYRI